MIESVIYVLVGIAIGIIGMTKFKSESNELVNDISNIINTNLNGILSKLNLNSQDQIKSLITLKDTIDQVNKDIKSINSQVKEITDTINGFKEKLKENPLSEEDLKSLSTLLQEILEKSKTTKEDGTLGYAFTWLTNILNK